ncbi:MAG: hypothetical protein ACERKS_02800 [Candidatus Bathyarchaeota archaeon]
MSAGFRGSKYCWMNGNVMETKDALVSPMEPIHLGIFEGIKAYVEGDVLGEGTSTSSAGSSTSSGCGGVPPWMGLPCRILERSYWRRSAPALSGTIT